MTGSPRHVVEPEQGGEPADLIGVVLHELRRARIGSTSSTSVAWRSKDRLGDPARVLDAVLARR